jgi:HK97 family phage prohead protease
MIIRTKGGDFRAGNASVLLDFLGVKKEAAGVQKVAGDVELIASVPFSMSNEKGAMSNEGGISWTFSTFDLDRYCERIDPAGWDFSQYVKNPVIEWAHCFHIPAIGKAENIHADENGLHGVLFFNDKSFDPFGWSIVERVKAGVIRAGSVGFRVMEIEIPSKEDSKDGTALIFRKQELLEFSICNVPANPFALEKTMSNAENSHPCEFSAWTNVTHSSAKALDTVASMPPKTIGDKANPFWDSFINNL